MNKQEQAISTLSSAMSSLARAIIGLTEEVRKIKAEQVSIHDYLIYQGEDRKNHDLSYRDWKENTSRQ